MSDVRCRACGAAVPDQAQWCSLCFADLRAPAPEPVREPVSVPAAPAHESVAAVPQPLAPVAAAVPAQTAGLPAAAVEAAPAAPAVATSPAAPAAPTAPAKDAKAAWPCPRCGATVPISLDECTDCGAGFLSGATETTTTHIPLVGDVGKMSQGQRLLVGAGISILLMFFFVLVLEVGGHIF